MDKSWGHGPCGTLLFPACVAFCFLRLLETIALDRKQTAFRLRKDLLERLKIEARKENRSLNNYVESVLMDVVYREPNDETLAAMKEAEEGKIT